MGTNLEEQLVLIIYTYHLLCAFAFSHAAQVRELRLSEVREFDQDQRLEDGRTGFECSSALGRLSTDCCGFMDVDKAALAS